jgi:hypothetical protein
MFFSPNLVWAISSIVLWLVLPYDIQAFSDENSKDPDGFLGISSSCYAAIFLRMLVNFAYIGIYYTFWFVTIYVLKWSDRK